MFEQRAYFDKKRKLIQKCVTNIAENSEIDNFVFEIIPKIKYKMTKSQKMKNSKYYQAFGRFLCVISH